jgi:hypothetical protein
MSQHFAKILARIPAERNIKHEIVREQPHKIVSADTTKDTHSTQSSTESKFGILHNATKQYCHLRDRIIRRHIWTQHMVIEEDGD